MHVCWWPPPPSGRRLSLHFFTNKYLKAEDPAIFLVSPFLPCPAGHVTLTEFPVSYDELSKSLSSQCAESMLEGAGRHNERKHRVYSALPKANVSSSKMSIEPQLQHAFTLARTFPPNRISSQNMWPYVSRLR